MIDPRDLRDLASELSLRPMIVEKDYVLGWLLAGISEDPLLGSAWVFKGGTCLKKVHFETYRFSEDLDFTVTTEDALDPAVLLEHFASISEWIYEQSGIEIPSDQLRFDAYDNKRGHRSIEGRVYYRGPLRAPRSLPKIKLDLTSDEILVLDAERQRVFHPYRDEPADGVHVRCYAYSEIFAEKVRALHERGRPRDLYDVVSLFRREEARRGAPDIRDVLLEKCRYKGIDLPTLASVQAYEPELRGLWDSMLRHQLPSLPPFDSFWNELPPFFLWLEGKEVPAEAAPLPMGSGEELVQVPLGGFGPLGLRSTPLETIRFAAANRLVVELDYRDEQGERSTRRIEPYSLRRTDSGNVVLHAERADGGGHRSYRVDRMLGARPTSESFAPQHAIELTAGGFQHVPHAARAASSNRSPMTFGSGPQPVQYVYECTVCGRYFRRKKPARRLRPHKTPAGHACPGRNAAPVRTGP